MKPKPAILHQVTAALLAVLLAALGWFVRSEAAHDHLHFHPTATQLAAKGKISVAGAGQITTPAPRWLKLGPAPEDAAPQAPAGPHRHRSVAFDSLAAGQWCGLFAPAALPLPDLPMVAGPVLRPLAAPLRTHWVLLPGRAPPVAG